MKWLALGLLLIVALIVIEGKRQQKRYGRSTGRGVSAMRAGLLDLQGHLEPERKVEILLRESVQGEAEESGEPPSSEDAPASR